MCTGSVCGARSVLGLPDSVDRVSGGVWCLEKLCILLPFCPLSSAPCRQNLLPLYVPLLHLYLFPVPSFFTPLVFAFALPDPGRLYVCTPWRGILSQAIFNPFQVLCPRLPSTSSFSRFFLLPLSPSLSLPLGCGAVSVSSCRRANGIYRLGLPGVLRRAMHPIRSMWRWVAEVGRACGCGSRWHRPSRSRAVCG